MQDIYMEDTGGPLFASIPPQMLSSEQLNFIIKDPDPGYPRLHTLRQPLVHWDDAISYLATLENQSLNIWSENGTIVSVVASSYLPNFRGMTVACSLHCGHEIFSIIIYGRSRDAMAHTATKLLCCTHPTLRVQENNGPEQYEPAKYCELYEKASRSMYFETNRFYPRQLSLDYSFHFEEPSLSFAKVLRPDQLAEILDANPSRTVQFSNGKWSAKHAVAMASRRAPMDLLLSYERDGDSFTFEDGGAAFVTAIQQRIAPFGALSIDFGVWYPDIPFLHSPMHDLMVLAKKGKFQSISLSVIGPQFNRMPFYFQAEALHYKFYLVNYYDFELAKVDPSVHNLSLQILLDDAEQFWHTNLVALFKRLSTFHHFEKLKLSIHYNDPEEIPPGVYPREEVVAVLKALCELLQSNQGLVCLDLGGSIYFDVELAENIGMIFQAVEKHTGLETIILDHYRFRDRDHYTHERNGLHQLFRNNPKVAVYTTKGAAVGSEWLLHMRQIALGLCGFGTLSVDQRAALIVEAKRCTVADQKRNKALAPVARNAWILSQNTDALCHLFQHGSPDWESWVEISRAVQKPRIGWGALSQP